MAGLGHVLADEEHARVAPHLLRDRFLDRLAVRQLAHGRARPSGIDILVHLAAGSGIGAASANCTPVSISAFTSARIRSNTAWLGETLRR